MTQSSSTKSARNAKIKVTERARRTVDDNPMSIIAGGVAIGVLAGALLPKTRREQELMGNVGRKITAVGSDAVNAARDAGKAELAELGLTKGAARDQVSKLLDGVVGVISRAGSAAADAAKTRKA